MIYHSRIDYFNLNGQHQFNSVICNFPRLKVYLNMPSEIQEDKCRLEMANFPIKSWLVQNLQNRIEVHHCCFLCRKRIKCLIRYFNSESFPTIRIYNEMYSQHVRPEHNSYLLSSKILRIFTIIHYVQPILRLSTSWPNLQVFFNFGRAGIGYPLGPGPHT